MVVRFNSAQEECPMNVKIDSNMVITITFNDAERKLLTTISSKQLPSVKEDTYRETICTAIAVAVYELI